MTYDEIDFPARDDADAKAWFYLDHRSDLEKWAAQRNDAAEVLQQYLRSLEPAMAEMAGAVDAEVDQKEYDDGAYGVIGIHRVAWTHDGLNDVSVTMEWEPESLLDPNGRNEWPYTAVRFHGDKDDKERWRQLQSALAPVRKRGQGRSGYPWPYWRYAYPPAHMLALEPEALARTFFTSFRQLWDEAAPILDALHAGKS
jgi:hypothetical protein